MGEVIALLSGKGGTGKTSLCAGIATALAAEGKRVLCIDCDAGLRNLDLMLGLSELAALSYEDVCSGGYPLGKAAVHPLYPTCSFLTAPMNVAAEQIDADAFREMLKKAKKEFDYIFLDAPSGIGSGFSMSAEGADRVVLVSGYDPGAVRNASRAAQELELMGKTRVQLIINRLEKKMFAAMKLTVDDIIDEVGVPLLGIVPEDEQVTLAIAAKKPLMKQTKKGAAAACIRIAKRLQGKEQKISI